MKEVKKAWFYKKNKLHPPYFYLAGFMVLTLISWILKLCGVVYITDAFMLGILGFFSAWMGFYKFQEIKNGKSNNN